MARTRIEEETFKAAFQKYGEPHQLMILFEEMAELMKEVSKGIRYSKEIKRNSIAEEIADVEIMLEQCKMIFDIPDDDVEGWRLDKIVRLRHTLGIIKQMEGEPPDA